MKLILQLAVILFFFAIGELIVYLTHVVFPGSIIGMILLIAALEMKILKDVYVKDVSNFFLNNMMLFFVPLGVGLMDKWGLISKEWLPIIVSTIVSTFIVLTVVALIIQKKSK